MSLSLVLSTCRSKYTPGERTSWLTTTRSVPLMMKVPLSVISGKSPMNTVWLLISPVVLLMNSAVTNIGAEKVMSFSLHSCAVYLGGSNRWSRNDSDIVPVKSSIGLISSKISSRPDCSDRSFRPSLRSVSIRPCQRSLPSSQSNESVCRASRLGTSRGSLIRANEMRCGPGAIAEALRKAANRGPSELVAERSPRARQTSVASSPLTSRHSLADTVAGHSLDQQHSLSQHRGLRCYRGHVGAAQIGSVVYAHTARQLYCTLILTVEGSIAPEDENVKRTGHCVAISINVTKLTLRDAFSQSRTRAKVKAPHPAAVPFDETPGRRYGPGRGRCLLCPT